MEVVQGMAGGCGCESSGGGEIARQPRALHVSWADGSKPPPPPTEVEGLSQRFVTGKYSTPAGSALKVSHETGWRERLGGWRARWGIGRMGYKVAPGLYAFGDPGPESPVVISCNYKLTFDLLRRTWRGLDLWVVTLDTRGVNVWCAAGKGTFGTEEVVRRVTSSRMVEVVTGRKVIVPQLGAPGVDAGEVKRRTGFTVVYGPVRASDLAEFLASGMKATPAMRRVTFSTLDRLVLTPIELVGSGKQLGVALLVALFVSGFGSWGWSAGEALQRGSLLFGAMLLGLLCGAVLAPVALPLLPGRMFSVKGAFAGLLVGVPAALAAGFGLAEGVGLCGAAVAVASYSAMNFTGATTFTSQSGVLKEMKRSLPLQMGGALASLAAWVAAGFAVGGGR